MLKFYLFLIIAFLTFLPAGISGQNFSGPIDLGKIKSSTILKELRERKARNPKLSTRQLAVIGNKLLKAHGSNFSIDPGAYRRVPDSKYTLTYISGKNVSFEVDEPFGGPCNEVILYLPIRKITAAEILLVAGGSTYRLKRPKEFSTEEFVLVDRSLKKVSRRWAAPIDATPYGISADGRTLYFHFDFHDPVYQNSLQFQDLIYEIGGDGTIRFIAKSDPSIIRGKRLEVKDSNGDFEYMTFKGRKRNYIVRYFAICS